MTGDKWTTSGRQRLKARQTRTLERLGTCTRGGGRSRIHRPVRPSTATRNHPSYNKRNKLGLTGTYSEWADPIARRGIAVSCVTRNDPFLQEAHLDNRYPPGTVIAEPGPQPRRIRTSSCHLPNHRLEVSQKESPQLFSQMRNDLPGNSVSLQSSVYHDGIFLIPDQSKIPPYYNPIYEAEANFPNGFPIFTSEGGPQTSYRQFRLNNMFDMGDGGSQDGDVASKPRQFDRQQTSTSFGSIILPPTPPLSQGIERFQARSMSTSCSRSLVRNTAPSLPESSGGGLQEWQFVSTRYTEFFDSESSAEPFQKILSFAINSDQMDTLLPHSSGHNHALNFFDVSNNGTSHLWPGFTKDHGQYNTNIEFGYGIPRFYRCNDFSKDVVGDRIPNKYWFDNCASVDALSARRSCSFQLPKIDSDRNNTYCDENLITMLRDEVVKTSDQPVNGHRTISGKLPYQDDSPCLQAYSYASSAAESLLAVQSTNVWNRNQTGLGKDITERNSEVAHGRSSRDFNVLPRTTPSATPEIGSRIVIKFFNEGSEVSMTR